MAAKDVIITNGSVTETLYNAEKVTQSISSSLASEFSSHTGNVGITGDLAVSGSISGGEIVENMPVGYGFNVQPITGYTVEYVYGGIVKNGNKLTIVYAVNITRETGATTGQKNLCYINVPSDIGAKLYPANVGGYDFLTVGKMECFSSYGSSVPQYFYLGKSSNTELPLILEVTNLVEETKYYCRFEITFLLSDNMISE